eukprot:CAMPEP_0196655256 /NCGR_PEP_ID=MMETSP1086-20130531/5000_1 /TAXON_ID=77921 /ORGANISM="Cyanoptyche  gloeocystis , Strain SAG4.97" /LENGTH=489 /DNA_ID=CAMNT_0041987467 /DNA_START=65 /DNA_END=1534 /DNA_ORIENTATION=+
MQYFSIEAFFIALRETIEICLVVGILLCFLEKTGHPEKKRQIWIGAGLGIVASVAVGVAFGVVKYQSGKEIFVGNTEAIFEGITFLVACLLITYMIYWSMKNGRDLVRHLASSAQSSLDTGSRWGMAFLAFLQVFKEGIELTILILGASGEDPKSLPIPAVIGISTAILACWLFFRGTLELNLRHFFLWSNLLLTMFAAGLASRGFHELQEAQWWGPFEVEDASIVPWWNWPLWNTENAAPKDTNGFWSVMRYMFGYEPDPNFVEFIAYFGYWTLIVIMYVTINYREIVAAHSPKSTKRNMFAFSAYIMINAIIGVIFASDPTYRSWNGITISSLWLFISLVGIFVALFPSKPLVMLLMSISIVGVIIATGFNIADLAEGYDGKPGKGVQRFFYWMLVWDWEWANSYELGEYLTPICLLSITLFMNLIICGGYSWMSWLWYRRLDFVPENNKEIDTEMQMDGLDPVSEKKQATEFEVVSSGTEFQVVSV